MILLIKFWKFLNDDGLGMLSSHALLGSEGKASSIYLVGKEILKGFYPDSELFESGKNWFNRALFQFQKLGKKRICSGIF